MHLSTSRHPGRNMREYFVPGFIVRPGRALFVRLWLLAALLAGATSAHAGTAVVTFTNFPPAVSNTYNGVITLQIKGLTNGVTSVIVQKFLDLNTNGVIDSGDLLVQQFPLTVGQAPTFVNGSTVVTVTNFFPGDMTLTTTGQITAPLNFQNGDFMQTLVGQYIYRVSSPSGQFSPVTQIFDVTNAPFSSLITGAVENASSPSGLLISNAIVLLCVDQNGNLNVQEGAVANSSGNFSLRAPPNSQYLLVAAASNWVSDLSQATFNLAAKQTNIESVGLTPATVTIAGRIVDAATNSLGLPGLAGLALSTNNFFSLYTSDTNGNFYAPALSNAWVAPVSGFAAAFAGYLTWQTNQLLNVSNTVVTVTNALARANAIFYGTVSNNSAAAMPGVYLNAYDSAGHESSAMTDQHGNYVMPVIAGSNEWELTVQAANNPGLTNTYVFNPAYLLTNTIGVGQAIPQNFVLAQAPYSISGAVYDINNNPISGVQVFANSTNYQATPVTTASDGTYSLQVSPGTWTVGVDSNSLINLGYTNFPPSQTVTISDASASGINFYIVVCGEVQILTSNLPDAMVGSPYNTSLMAESCGSISNWSTAYGFTLTSLYDQTNLAYRAGTSIYSDPGLVGYSESYFSFGYTYDGLNDPVFFSNNISYTLYLAGEAYFDNLATTINVSAPITNQIAVYFPTDPDPGRSWLLGPTTQNGSTYSAPLVYPPQNQFGDGYNHSIEKGTWAFTVTNGDLIRLASGGASNTVAKSEGRFQSLAAVGNTLNLASTIPYTGSNDAVVWVQTGTNPPGQYLISAYGTQSTNLPPGLTLYPDGTISGTPASTGTNGGTFNFTVAAEDDAADASVQPLSLLVYPATTVTVPASSTNGPAWSSNQFQLQVNGVLPGQNYTLLMNTNLATTNWVPIFTTNAPDTNALLIPDSNATNPERFYRVQVGP